MFTGDIKEQGRKLVATLTFVIGGLKDHEAVIPADQALAKRHVAYGVMLAHYAPVGAALLWTLSTGFGEAFTADVEEAWLEVYTGLSGAMIVAAYS